MNTMVGELAQFVQNAQFEQLSYFAVETLKIRILDAIACAVGASGSDPVHMVHRYITEMGGKPQAGMFGGGKTSADRAALYNGFLVRYLDFNDSYLAPGETCHPSDNVAPVLAAAEYADANGKDFLTALAIAYQVQCRLSDVAPVRDKGFDHTVQGMYAVAAAVGKVMKFDDQQLINAIAIAGTAFNALRVTRTGSLSHWKGLAYPNAAFSGVHAALLAKQGITGPRQVFEGNKGFMDSIAGHFEIDWQQEDLEIVTQTITKEFNAEIHSQSTLEGVMDLRNEHQIDAFRVDRVDLETFDVAFNIIGGGEEGDKTKVTRKEEADHSLHYMIAAALLDGHVMPEQYRQDRIESDDIQQLLQKVHVSEADDLSDRFPGEMPIRLRITMDDGKIYSIEKNDYKGFTTRPAKWENVKNKFDQLTYDRISESDRKNIETVIQTLDDRPVFDLTRILNDLNLHDQY